MAVVSGLYTVCTGYLMNKKKPQPLLVLSEAPATKLK